MVKPAGKLPTVLVRTGVAKRSDEAVRRSTFGVFGVDRRSEGAANIGLVNSYERLRRLVAIGVTTKSAHREGQTQGGRTSSELRKQ
jgi:hypothetical protein